MKVELSDREITIAIFALQGHAMQMREAATVTVRPAGGECELTRDADATDALVNKLREARAEQRT
jgi:hypothetical protein